MASELPIRIHRYRILDELGQGAMGRVFLAEDPNLDRRIALKVLSPRRVCEPDQEEELRQRFLKEARAAGGLSHPGIVTIYDADTDPETGEPYLAMEWVDGSSLRALLAGEGRLAIGTALSLAGQAARALDHAHRQSVVHRDVKPANLLLSGNGTVKVADFGIAKLVFAGDVTGAGRILGSPHYMSPEQVRGDPVDGRSDLFALGAVLYECLTGELAFGGTTLANVNYKIVSVDPRPPEIYNPAVPPALRAIVDRTLAKHPPDRFQTGAELADALAELEQELVPSGTLAATGTRRPARPGGRRVDDPSTLPLSGDTVGLPSEPRTGTETPATASPVPPEKAAGRRRWRLAAAVGLALAAGMLLSQVVGGPDFGGAADPEPAVATVPAQPPAAAPPPAAPSTARQAETPPPPPASSGPADAAEPADQQPWASSSAVLDVRDSLADFLDEPPPRPGPRNAPGPQAADAASSEPTADLRTRSGAAAPAPQTFLSAPPPAAPATLEIVHRTYLAQAYLSVWIDGEKALTAELDGGGVLRRTFWGRQLKRQISVPAGKHSVEVHVSGVSKPLETREIIDGDFTAGALKRLEVRVDSTRQTMQLSWKG